MHSGKTIIGLLVSAMTALLFSAVLVTDASEAAAVRHEITVTQAEEGGSIAPNPKTGKVSVVEGRKATFTIKPSRGYHVLDIMTGSGSVLDDATVKGKVYKYVFDSVTSNNSITATFEKDTYELTVAINGSGSVAATGLTCGENSTCSGTYTYGDSVTLTATPGSGFEMKNWSGCKADKGQKTSCTLKISKNTTVTAGFKAETVKNTKGKITLKGLLGGGYVSASSSLKSPRKSESDRKVDKVIAIQSERGHLSEDSMIYSKSADIGPDGSFLLSLEKTKDWLLVLMDSTAADRTNQFVGYVALNTGTSESLLQVPLSTSRVSSVDLGTITASGDTAQSENAVEAADFSMTQQQLLEVAKNDDIFKSVKNLVLNYDSTNSVYYLLRPDFKWRGDYDAIDGGFQQPDQYTYQHYQFQLDTNSTGLTIDKICGTNGQTKTEVKIVPPSDVQAEGQTPLTYNAAYPMSSANVTCTPATDGHIEVWNNEAFYATDRYGSVSQSYGASLLGAIPSGYWTYYEGADLRGQFDVAVSSPLTAESKIKGYTPAIKVNSDETGKITSVDIKWYSLDASTNQYTELTDVSLLRYFIGTGDVYFDNTTNGTRTYESIHFDPAADTSIKPSKYTWYYGTDGQENRQAQGIGIFYNSGGTGYFFEFFRQQ